MSASGILLILSVKIEFSYLVIKLTIIFAEFSSPDMLEIKQCQTAHARCHTHATVNVQDSKMSSVKRKVDRECRVFKEQWTNDYFFVQCKGRAVCIICKESVAVFKEYNLRRHHETRHKEYTSLRGQAREDRIRRMKGGLAAQQNVFLRQTQVNQAAVRANYKVAHLLATHGKLFTDGDLVKECMVAVAEEVCPDKKDALNVVSLSAPTMTRRIEDLGDNVYDQM